MATEPIRLPIRQLSKEITNVGPDALILVDDGVSMGRAKASDAIDKRAAAVADQKIAALNLDTASQQPVEAFATAAQGVKADTAVQPAREITAGTGLTGGGDLSADRTLALSSASIGSLNKADTAMQPSIYDPDGKEADAFDSANQAYDNAASGLASSTAQDAIDELAGRDVVRVEDRTALKALNGTETPAAIVYGEGGRNGVFVFVSGDQSALVALDPSEILYVAPASDTSGASGVWSRQFDGRYVLAEWSGAPGGTSVDNAPALQALIDLCQELDLTPVLRPGRHYGIDSTLTLKQGRASPSDKRYNARLHGEFAALVPSMTNGYALHVVPQAAMGSGAGNNVAVIDIKDLYFAGYRNAQSRAIRVGSNGQTATNFEYSRIKNIRTEGMTGEDTILLKDCLRIYFDNIVLRGGQLSILCTDTGQFTGDFTFDGLEITGSTAAKPGLRIVASQGSGTDVPTIRGIRFNNCVFYGSGYEIVIGSNGRIGDIWFNSPQFDVGSSTERTFVISTSGIGGEKSLFGVHIVHPYIVNYKSEVIYLNAAEVGDIRNIYIDGAQIGTITTNGSSLNTVIALNNILSSSVVNTYISAVEAGAANASIIRLLGSCDGIQVIGIRGTRNELIPRGLQIAASVTNTYGTGIFTGAIAEVYQPTVGTGTMIFGNRGDVVPS